MDKQNTERSRQARPKDYLRDLEWLVNSESFPNKASFQQQLSKRMPLLWSTLFAFQESGMDLLALRDEIRRAWAGGPDASETMTRLLHLDESLGSHKHNTLFLALYRLQTDKVMGKRVVADWKTGSIQLRDLDPFQMACSYLLKSSHLAKICASKWDKCGRRYFIADRGNQRYCDDSCFDSTKRQRAVDYWNEKGAKRRAAAQRKGRKK